MTSYHVTEFRTLHRDHLGSVVAISDDQGNLVERISYDAFGKRRNSDWTRDPGDLQYTQNHTTTRGYTGHEQLDTVKLVHMNGRVYDPILGRFLSADPTVQYPESTQGFNRYTYVNNNPLTYTDPSGFGFFSDVFDAIGDVLEDIADLLEDNWRTIAAAAITVVAPYAGAGLWASAAAGFASGMIVSGGDLEAGLIGAVTAAAFYQVGTAFSTKGVFGKPSTFGGHVGKVVLHGAVGGVSRDWQGGSFTAGFYSASFTQAASQAGIVGAIGGDSVPGRTAVAAVIGGTGAEIGGGKFANGAVTGAFSYSFNDCLHGGCGFLGGAVDARGLAAQQKLAAQTQLAEQQANEFLVSFEGRQMVMNGAAAGLGTASLVPLPSAVPLRGAALALSAVAYVDALFAGHATVGGFLLLGATGTPAKLLRVPARYTPAVTRIQDAAGVGVSGTAAYIGVQSAQPDFCAGCR